MRFHPSCATILLLLTAASPASAQEAGAAIDRSRDRGPGVATSMFATYVTRGQLILYPFFEHYRNENLEYRPSELGFAGEEELTGRYRANEGLVFVGYGLTDNLAFEVEASVIHASLTKSPLDMSAVPVRTGQSGLGDVEGQIRWRWRTETEERPEWFSYAELVVLHHREKALIGTAGVQVKAGTGLTRGWRWGTVTLRGAVEYDRASSSPFDLGECAVEYIRRVSPAWRVYVGLEGQGGEESLITDLQWHFSRQAFLRINNGFALTSAGTDWAPELGIVFTFSPR